VTLPHLIRGRIQVVSVLGNLQQPLDLFVRESRKTGIQLLETSPHGFVSFLFRTTRVYSCQCLNTTLFRFPIGFTLCRQLLCGLSCFSFFRKVTQDAFEPGIVFEFRSRARCAGRIRSARPCFSRLTVRAGFCSVTVRRPGSSVSRA
jgi:hypothetical protein